MLIGLLRIIYTSDQVFNVSLGRSQHHQQRLVRLGLPPMEEAIQMRLYTCKGQKVKLYACIEKKKHTKYTVSLIFIIFHFAFLKFCSQNARVKFLHPLLMISKDFEIKIATIPNTNRKH